MIKITLWIGHVHSELQDGLPKFGTALALSNTYAVFATSFHWETYYDYDRATITKTRETLEGSEKKFGSLKTQLESVSTGAYIGIRTGTERLILARSDACIRAVVQLGRLLRSAEEDVCLVSYVKATV
ncbi:hypothetical protein ISF_09692 [Cordyceps fumosorosea ARSEF 2679]|uniref:Uncharacterized protein n=1 Tax=Cordyceps fumosorosea (strain ARSEF 2679) TaxID=1081104 RepID=A0A167DRU4_CORFA|nr:hypothetical protein ISF_09692 [Cordyceps fumosorosea ARSEF 2679]OAA42776.1 hypothetical protein ISF_09692 [Cordyceps fumosorosea ARSEF 2679]